MKITGLLKKEGVKLGVVAASQDEAIDVLVDLQCGIGAVADATATSKPCSHAKLSSPPPWARAWRFRMPKPML